MFGWQMNNIISAFPAHFALWAVAFWRFNYSALLHESFDALAQLGFPLDLVDRKAVFCVSHIF